MRKYPTSFFKIEEVNRDFLDYLPHKKGFDPLQKRIENRERDSLLNTGFPVTHEEINEIEKLKHKDVKDLEYFFQRSSITIQKIIDGKKKVYKEQKEYPDTFFKIEEVTKDFKVRYKKFDIKKKRIENRENGNLLNSQFPITHEEIEEIKRQKDKDIDELENYFQRSGTTINDILDGKITKKINEKEDDSENVEKNISENFSITNNSIPKTKKDDTTLLKNNIPENNQIVLYEKEKNNLLSKIEQLVKNRITNDDLKFLEKIRSRINLLNGLPIMLSFNEYLSFQKIIERTQVEEKSEVQSKPNTLDVKNDKKNFIERKISYEDINKVQKETNEKITIKRNQEKTRIVSKFEKKKSEKDYVIDGIGKENMIKRIVLSLMDSSLNGWEMTFLQNIKNIIKFSGDDPVLISPKRYYRLEQVFEKTNIYTEDIMNLSLNKMKSKKIDNL